jgi:hypothetical protein
MDKRFVKLGEKYYVVEMQGEKGLTLVPATDKDILDEQFEHAALLGGDANDIGNDNFLQQVIDSTKGEMVKALKQGLKKTVLSCLGFSERNWGGQVGFEVDHCNSRMSEVTNHITVTLKQILRNATEEELGITEAERADLIATYRKDLLKQYNDKLRYNIWSMVDRLAAEDAKKVAESLVKERSEQVGAIILDKLFNKTKQKV